MVRRAILAAMAAMVSWAAQAEHAAAPEAKLVPAVTREVCTESVWGFDEIRTDCRFELHGAPQPNPALKDICTTYYGQRVCHCGNRLAVIRIA